MSKEIYIKEKLTEAEIAWLEYMGNMYYLSPSENINHYLKPHDYKPSSTSKIANRMIKVLENFYRSFNGK